MGENPAGHGATTHHVVGKPSTPEDDQHHHHGIIDTIKDVLHLTHEHPTAAVAPQNVKRYVHQQVPKNIKCADGKVRRMDCDVIFDENGHEIPDQVWEESGRNVTPGFVSRHHPDDHFEQLHEQQEQRNLLRNADSPTH
jgi:hypothetical protein